MIIYDYDLVIPPELKLTALGFKDGNGYHMGLPLL